MSEALDQLIYFSLWRPDSGSSLQQAMEDILAVSTQNNRRAGVTGALVGCNGWFLQLLEGPGESVNDVYTKISADMRHQTVTRIGTQAVNQRAFPYWSMCGAHFSPTDEAIIKSLGRQRGFSPPELTFADALRILAVVQEVQAQRE